MRFLDWQDIRVGSVAIDIGYLIFCCTDAKLRKRLPELLANYHEALTARIKLLGGPPELFPSDRLQYHMKTYAKFGFG